MIDYGKGFTFFTDDDHWLEKLGIGVGVLLASFIAAVLLVLVPSFLFYLILPLPLASTLASQLVYYLSIMPLVGYGLRLLQNVRAGVSQPLPEWNDWGNDLIRGFKLIVVNLIWMLPLLIFYVPTGIGMAMNDNLYQTSSVFGSMLATCGGCLGLLYFLFVAIMRPGFTLAFLRDEQIQSGLRFELIFNWTRRNVGSVVTVAIVSVLAATVCLFLGAIVGVILLCVGWIITVPLGVLLPVLIQSHLYGQLAREYPLDESAPIVPGPPSESDFNPPMAPAA